MALTVISKSEYNIPDQKDIKCPTIKVEVTANFDDSDPFDQAKYVAYSKAAQKHLDKMFLDRCKQFEEPIKDAQKKVESIRTLINEQEKLLKGDPKKWAKLPDQYKKLVEEKKHLDEFMNTANESIKQAVRSIETFEVNRWMEPIDQMAHIAAEKAIKSKQAWKIAKLVAKVFVIGVVILATAAIGIAASVVTLNPGPLALAAVIIGAVVSGSSALIGLGKLIKKNWTNESSVMKKIGEDLAALGKVTEEIKKKRTPQLEKHLKELASYRADRAKAIREITAKISEMEKASVDLQKKFAEAIKNNLKGANDRMNTLFEFKKAITELKAQKQKLEAEDEAAQKVIKASREVLSDYDQIGQKDIKGLPSTWDKLRGNLGGATEKTAGLLQQAVNLSSALQK